MVFMNLFIFIFIDFLDVIRIAADKWFNLFVDIFQMFSQTDGCFKCLLTIVAFESSLFSVNSDMVV